MGSTGAGRRPDHYQPLTGRSRSASCRGFSFRAASLAPPQAREDILLQRASRVPHPSVRPSCARVTRDPGGAAVTPFVGTPGFEPGAFGPPDRHANQTAPRPATPRLAVRRRMPAVPGRLRQLSATAPRPGNNARTAARHTRFMLGRSYDVPGIARVARSFETVEAARGRTEGS